MISLCFLFLTTKFLHALCIHLISSPISGAHLYNNQISPRTCPPLGVKPQNTQASKGESPSCPHLSLPLHLGHAGAVGEVCWQSVLGGWGVWSLKGRPKALHTLLWVLEQRHPRASGDTPSNCAQEEPALQKACLWGVS